MNENKLDWCHPVPPPAGVEIKFYEFGQFGPRYYYEYDWDQDANGQAGYKTCMEACKDALTSIPEYELAMLNRDAIADPNRPDWHVAAFLRQVTAVIDAPDRLNELRVRRLEEACMHALAAIHLLRKNGCI